MNFAERLPRNSLRFASLIGMAEDCPRYFAKLCLIHPAIFDFGNRTTSARGGYKARAALLNLMQCGHAARTPRTFNERALLQRGIHCHEVSIELSAHLRRGTSSRATIKGRTEAISPTLRQIASVPGYEINGRAFRKLPLAEARAA
jgi:hypothetical protein